MSYLAPSKEFMERSKLDQMAILGYAHNTGWNAALKWLQSGEVSEDGFGTKSTKFYEALKKAFADQIQLPESSANQHLSLILQRKGQKRSQIQR